MLRFRRKTEFSQCDTCFALKSGIKSASDIKAKFEKVAEYQDHINGTMTDRAVFWTQRASSPLGEGARSSL